MGLRATSIYCTYSQLVYRLEDPDGADADAWWSKIDGWNRVEDLRSVRPVIAWQVRLQ